MVLIAQFTELLVAEPFRRELLKAKYERAASRAVDEAQGRTTIHNNTGRRLYA